MQVLKEQVREAILAAALEQFSAGGYKRTSMRAIARAAQITPGNIYAYFPSKELLFHTLIQPLSDEVRRLCALDFPSGAAVTLDSAINEMLDVFLRHSGEFLLLINDDSNPYSMQTRQELCAVVSQRIAEHLHTDAPSAQHDPLFAYALAEAMLQGLQTIIKDSGGDIQRLHGLVSEFMRLLFSGLPVSPRGTV
ncbi:MAG: TetR/AcrR family transcriptional regulator [Bacillota bacterium]|nr:TetR/AcrR family transcriptional regulator [Bacillota bacterium]